MIQNKPGGKPGFFFGRQLRTDFRFFGAFKE